MKKFLFSIFFSFAALAVSGQDSVKINLWPDGFPDTNGLDISKPFDDAAGNYNPRLTVYMPAKDKATGQAVLCIPGGGYGTVCYDTEGYNWVPYFLDHGIAIGVLVYRLPYGHCTVPANDAFEAMRIMRKNATKWGYSPDKIGVMGHSAGGHLCATVATHAEGDAKPNFQILMYPVITMDKSYAHMGTHNNLIGENPLPEVENYYSMEKQVKPGQAPAIIFVTTDDKIVPVRNSIEYYSALQRAGVPVSLHVYPSGPHGFSCHKWFAWHDSEIHDLFQWLDDLNKQTSDKK